MIVQDKKTTADATRLVRETKGSLEKEDLRGRERKKIDCGQAHFKALGVDYKVVTSHNEI